MPRKRKMITIQWQALTSTISTTLVLVLLGLVLTCAMTTRRLSDSVRKSFTVTVILSDESTDQSAKAFKKRLQKRPWVSEVTYISREDALREQTEAMGTDPTEFLGQNPFSPTLELHVAPAYACSDSLIRVSKMLKKEAEVADVMYQKDLVESLNSNLQRVTMVLLALAGILLLITMVLINNTVRLSVYSRRFIIHTMKLVGASWAFICRPFLWRAMWIGLVGGLLADAVLVVGAKALWSFDESMMEYVTMHDIAITMLTVMVSGLLLTLMCTLFSVTHYLGMREKELYG